MSRRASLSPGAMQLAFCVDDGFCQHLAALIVSIQRHTQSKIDAHVISDGLSSSNQKLLLEMQKPQFQIHFHEVDLHTFSSLPISQRYAQRVNCATYYRMALPDLLPSKVKKVLYLDADMLVVDDIEPLWTEQLNGFAAAVVADGSLTQQSRWKTLGTSQPHYFNAGMLLINLELWREQGLAQHVLSFLEQEKDWDYNDQDLLNLGLNQQIKFLPAHWNTQSYHFSHLAPPEPKIVHFTGVEKPWHVSSVHPFAMEYAACRLASSYADYEPQLYLDSHDKKLLEKVKETITQPANIAIYGAGQRGRRLLHAFEELPHVNIHCFIDKQVDQPYRGTPVKQRIERQDVDYVVLSSVAFAEQIIQQLSLWAIPDKKIIRGEVNV